MTTVEASARQSEAKIRLSQDKFEPVLARIDLIAIVATLLGISLLGMAALVFAIIELARTISTLWSNQVARGLIICLALAVIWVIFRWKTSRLS